MTDETWSTVAARRALGRINVGRINVGGFDIDGRPAYAVHLLFLDDERKSSQVTWMGSDCTALYKGALVETTARGYNDFEAAFLNLLYLGDQLVISFDHDLMCFVDGKEKTGYDCLKLVVETCFDMKVAIPHCIFHTMNPIGRENMQAYYDNARSFQGI